ncbi:flavoprotein [Amorphoplanes nipponensis]|uniref:Flavoprotein n=1 Tax=Actinoplanes nipponensis TaxID=135950 RepID=A0A919MH40_9ACTN|nr:flavoprotein [Actinoplanes nipponensis]GIE49264.1 flavoprotein [Actinoplanes nipponensis]
MSDGHLRIVVCGAGPATDVHRLIEIAHQHSWTAAVTATATALPLLDVPMIEHLTGNPVRTSYRTSGRRVVPPVNAVIIAPATYNTIIKLALGIADTYPLTSAAELVGRGIPTVIVPYVNAALAARLPFQRAIVDLRAEGVRVLCGPRDDWEPHPPGAGLEARRTFPWLKAFQLAQRAASRQVHP